MTKTKLLKIVIAGVRLDAMSDGDNHLRFFVYNNKLKIVMATAKQLCDNSKPRNNLRLTQRQVQELEKDNDVGDIEVASVNSDLSPLLRMYANQQISIANEFI